MANEKKKYKKTLKNWRVKQNNYIRFHVDPCTLFYQSIFVCGNFDFNQFFSLLETVAKIPYLRYIINQYATILLLYSGN